MSVTGCFSLHLYCDCLSKHRDEMYNEHWNRHIYSDMKTAKRPGPNDYGMFGEYTGRTFADCARQARRDGWIVNEGRDRAVCPHHSHKLDWWAPCPIRIAEPKSTGTNQDGDG
jgi:hypothetical protein